MSNAQSAITSDDDNVRLLIDAFGLMVSRFPGHKIEHSGSVATLFADVPLSFFNMSILDRPLMEAAVFLDALALARSRAKAYRHPSLVGLCAAWAPSNWEDLTAEAGLRPALNMTGMAADCLLPARREPPVLEYRLASDAAPARDLARISALAYGMPVEEFECVAHPLLWKGNMFGVVGYAEGRAVTCAAAFPVADTIYVAFVATLPEAFGKGYAEAAMRRAIELAQAAVGQRRIWLHASDAGRPLYHSMGFESGAALPLLQFSEQSAGA